jgi:hypothetical protein
MPQVCATLFLVESSLEGRSKATNRAKENDDKSADSPPLILPSARLIDRLKTDGLLTIVPLVPLGWNQRGDKPLIDLSTDSTRTNSHSFPISDITPSIEIKSLLRKNIAVDLKEGQHSPEFLSPSSSISPTPFSSLKYTPGTGNKRGSNVSYGDSYDEVDLLDDINPLQYDSFCRENTNENHKNILFLKEDEKTRPQSEYFRSNFSSVRDELRPMSETCSRVHLGNSFDQLSPPVKPIKPRKKMDEQQINSLSDQQQPLNLMTESSESSKSV